MLREAYNKLKGVPFLQYGDLSMPWYDHLTARQAGFPQAFHTGEPDAWLRTVDPNDRDRVCEILAQNLDSNRPLQLSYFLKDPELGRVQISDFRWSTRLDGTVPVYQGFLIDVSEQHIASKRLQEQGWKDTLYSVTGGLLHDFGNTLSGIFSLGEIYYQRLEDEHPFKEGLRQIKDNSVQAYAIVRRILSLYRDQPGERRPQLISIILQEQAELLRAILPKYVRLTIHLEQILQPCEVDSVGLRQSLVNLVINARDAIDQHGEIHLALRGNIKPEDHRQTYFAIPPDWSHPYVEIEVRDNGCGIANDRWRLIFHPFYTTKSENMGSGLGLYNLCRFVEEHGGACGVRSELGKGSSFYILLPLQSPPLEKSARETPTTETCNGHAGRVRPVMIIIQCGMPMDDNLVQRLGELDWSVRMLPTVEELERYLREIHSRVDLIVYRTDQCSQPRLKDLQKLQPLRGSSKLAVQFCGQRDDELPREVWEKVDILLPQMEKWIVLSQRLKSALSTENIER